MASLDVGTWPPVATVQQYDWTTDTWSLLPSLPALRGGSATVLTEPDETVVTFGGATNVGSGTSATASATRF